MNLNNKQNNKIFKNTKESGFTIIEALVAVFILTISVLAMLNLTASSASSARYANNELTANYLLQEAIDSIRNSRDTLAFLQKDLVDGGWNNFKSRYGSPSSKCFAPNGCILKIEEFSPASLTGGDIVACSTNCTPLNYESSPDSSLFYKYSGGGSPSNFTRKVTMVDNVDNIKVTATVSWLNGTSQRTQSLEMNLFNWQE